MWFFHCWFIFVAFRFVSSAIQPMVCPSDTPPTTFDLTIKNPCSATAVSDNVTVHEAVAEVYKKNLAKYVSIGYKCWKVETTLASWTEPLRHNVYERPPVHKNVILSPTECRTMIEHKECLEGKLEGNQYSAMTTNKLEYPYTCGWNPKYHSRWLYAAYLNCFYISGKIFKKWNADMESTLGAVQDCVYEREECVLGDKSVIVWKVNATANKEFVPYQKMDGYTWNNQFLTAARDLGFTWSKKSRRVQVEPGKFGIITDQGIAVYLEETRIVPRGRPLGFASRTKRDVLESSALTAARSQAMEFRFFSFVDGLNRDFNSFCRLRHEMHEFDLIHSAAEPSLTARRLLNNSLLHGRLVGSILHVRPCRPVESFEFKKMTGPHCTEMIPLNYTMNGKAFSGYTDPKTLIIFKNSPLTDCHFMDHVILIDNSGKLFNYDRQRGQISPFRGSVTPLPMYEAVVAGFADYEMVIHKPHGMYPLYDDAITMNDYFETMQMMDNFMHRLANLDNHADPPPDFFRSIFQNLPALHPFGSFSPNWSRVHFIWQNLCCALVTLHVAWLFFMPRAVKAAVDEMAGLGKDRIYKLYRKAMKARDVEITPVPSAPVKDVPVPPPLYRFSSFD